MTSAASIVPLIRTSPTAMELMVDVLVSAMRSAVRYPPSPRPEQGETGDDDTARHDGDLGAGRGVQSVSPTCGPA